VLTFFITKNKNGADNMAILTEIQRLGYNEYMKRYMRKYRSPDFKKKERVKSSKNCWDKRAIEYGITEDAI
jgi:hypothetical protein